MDEKILEDQPRSAAGTFLPNIFIVTALLLIILPFVTTFNSFLTDIFLKFKFYKILQEFAIPYETKILASFLSLLPTQVIPTPNGIYVGSQLLQIEWNCLGWQSAVLLLATFLTGFHGKFTWISRLEVVMIGVLGTYLINFLRLFVVAVLATFVGNKQAVVFHDYLALLLVIAWFFLFWWFSYSYVLEER